MGYSITLYCNAKYVTAMLNYGNSFGSQKIIASCIGSAQRALHGAYSSFERRKGRSMNKNKKRHVFLKHCGVII